MVAQLVENFFHLERGGKRFDQHGRLDGADGESQRSCATRTPRSQPRLLGGLEFRQIEIGPGASRDLCRCIVKKVESKIEQRAETARRRPVRCSSTRCSRAGRTISTAGFSPSL